MTGRIFLTFIICLSKLCDDDKIKLKDKMEYFLYASIKVVVAIGYMLVGALWTSILVFSYRFFTDRDIEFVIGIVVLIIAIIEEVLVIKEFKKKHKINSTQAMVCLVISYVLVMVLLTISVSYKGYFITLVCVYLVDFVLDYYRVRIIKKAMKVENELGTSGAEEENIKG